MVFSLVNIFYIYVEIQIEGEFHHITCHKCIEGYPLPFFLTPTLDGVVVNSAFRQITRWPLYIVSDQLGVGRAGVRLPSG